MMTPLMNQIGHQVMARNTQDINDNRVNPATAVKQPAGFAKQVTTAPISTAVDRSVVPSLPTTTVTPMVGKSKPRAASFTPTAKKGYLAYGTTTGTGQYPSGNSKSNKRTGGMSPRVR